MTQQEKSEAEIVDNYRLDHLYSHAFKDGSGKFLTVVSRDEAGAVTVVDAEDPRPLRNKIKTTLTFVRDVPGGRVKSIELKRFKYYARRGYEEQHESIRFSFSFFAGLVGFLQGLAGLDLNLVNERRIPLADSPEWDAETRRRFRTLIATKEGQAMIAEAVRSGDLSSADIENIGYRKAQLALFEELLTGEGAVDRYRQEHGLGPGPERVWQHFFEANTWIFGYGLAFVFNKPLDGKTLSQAVHGSDAAGPGKITDALMKTAGLIRSLCLVEIKTPDDELVEEIAYRPDCWRASRALSGGIAQSQKTAQKTIENASMSPVLRPVRADGAPTGELIHSYQPRSFLIIGTLAKFKTEHGVNHEKFASFELLRRQIRQPEIITFDELLDRARFIVARS